MRVPKMTDERSGASRESRRGSRPIGPDLGVKSGVLLIGDGGGCCIAGSPGDVDAATRVRFHACQQRQHRGCMLQPVPSKCPLAIRTLPSQPLRVHALPDMN